MKNRYFKMVMFVAVLATFSSCTTLNHSMREPNTRLNFVKTDFTLSDQFTAEAKSVKVLGIDWERFFMKKTGVVEGGSSALFSLASIPVIGNLVSDKTINYSLYELMNNNPGYDVVFYPQYEVKVVKPFLGIGFLSKTTTVKTIARLGKLVP